MKSLWDVVKENLRENEDIFILREKDWKTNATNGIMEHYTYDELFNVYNGNEKVIQHWHEDGLCVIIK